MTDNPINLNPQINLQTSLDTARNQALESLLRIPVGAVVQGTVIGQDKNGNPILRLAGNDLVLSSPIALAKGSSVALKTVSVSSVIVAQVISVDGKPPTPQVLGPSREPPPPREGEKPALAAKAQAQIPTVRLVPVEMAKSAAPPPPQPVAPKEEVTDSPAVRLENPPQVKSVVITPNPGILAEARARIEKIPSPVIPFSSIPDELETGTQVSLKLVSIRPVPPSPSPSSLIPHAVPEITVKENGAIKLTAVVVGTEKSGDTVVETSLGTLKLATPVRLESGPVPKGSVIELEIASFAPATEGDSEILPPKPDLRELGRKWETLEKIAAALQPQKTAKAQHPAPPAHGDFGARLLGFISALKTGDAKAWLKSSVPEQDLARAPDSLMARFAQEFTAFQKTLAEPSSSGWHSFAFPVYDGETLSQARMSVRYQDEGEKRQKARHTGHTRFVIELELSHLGEFQFDGLVRSAAGPKNFDLLVRTHKALDREIEDEIRAIFSSAQGITGFSGSIEFSAAPSFPPSPFEEHLQEKESGEGGVWV